MPTVQSSDFKPDYVIPETNGLVQNIGSNKYRSNGSAWLVQRDYKLGIEIAIKRGKTNLAKALYQLLEQDTLQKVRIKDDSFNECMECGDIATELGLVGNATKMYLEAIDRLASTKTDYQDAQSGEVILNPLALDLAIRLTEERWKTADTDGFRDKRNEAIGQLRANDTAYRRQDSEGRGLMVTFSYQGTGFVYTVRDNTTLILDRDSLRNTAVPRTVEGLTTAVN